MREKTALWEQLAREKHLVMGQITQAAWQEAILSSAERLLNLGLQTAEVNKLIRAVDSANDLLFITDLFVATQLDFPLKPMPFQRLAQSVDNSPYSIGGWTAALELFAKWLEDHSSRCDLATQLGYLDCCVAAIQNKPTPPPLKDLLEEMLFLHGFDGARKI
jgi:hypothetical protein